MVVQVGAVKIYVAAAQALRKKETWDETQFTTKIGGKTSLGTPIINKTKQPTKGEKKLQDGRT